MSCRPAPACKAVLDQANSLWPHRSRASDGICASATHHKQNPTSDHEPDAHGIAHAVDLTHDPANGCDNDAIVQFLIARKDPRVKYLIHAKTIWRSYKTNAKQPPAWEPQAYGGPNPHTHHLHISVWTEHENDTSSWFTTAPSPPHEGDDVPAPSDVVASLQTPSGKGRWLLTYDGGVRTEGDAKFYGSVPGLDPKDRQDVGGFWVIEPYEGGYALRDTKGNLYRFGAG
jgi:hypothetical protein